MRYVELKNYFFSNSRPKISIPSCLFFLILIVSSINAQSEKQIFEQGISFFNQGKHEDAIKLLSPLTVSKNKYTEAATVSVIISSYFLQDFQRAKYYINQFEKSFPNSRAKFQVLSTKLLINLTQNEFDQFIYTLFQIDSLNISYEEIQKLKNPLKQFLSKTGELALISKKDSFINQNMKYLVTTILFENFIENQKSQNISNTYLELVDFVKRLHKKFEPKIGVLIASKNKETKLNQTEKLILEGIKYAIDESNTKNNSKIELKIFEGSEEQLEIGLMELAKDPSVLCVLGPLYSNQFETLSTIAEKLQIPLISPTATQPDLSTKSKFVFQFNPTLDLRGKAMAKFAVNKLNLQRFVILYTNDAFVKPVVNEFKKEIKLSNGEIIGEVEFKETAKSITSSIKEIKRIALKNDLVLKFDDNLDPSIQKKLLSLGIDPGYIDSLIFARSEISIFELLGKNAEKICDANQIKYFKRKTIYPNESEIPVYSIDAIYIPISNSKIIKNITNELANQNIRATVLGNDIWNSIQDLNKAYPSSDGVIFTSDFYLDENNPEIKNLSKKVFYLTGMNINRNFFYGYETAKKVLINLHQEINRLNFNESLRFSHYTGLTSDISLNQYGVNSSLYILEYRNRKIKKISNIIVN